VLCYGVICANNRRLCTVIKSFPLLYSHCDLRSSSFVGLVCCVILSLVSVLSNSPSEYLSESPPAPRGLASPLMTSKNSQKRGGFHWGEIGDSRMGTSTPSSTYALTFPRHNHRTLSSPNLLKSPEILGNIRKRNSPSSKSKQPPDTSPQHARHSVGSTNSGGLSSVGLGRSFSGGGFRV